MSDEMINEAMDEVEREKMAARGAAGPNGGDLAKPAEVVRIYNEEKD